MPDLALGRVSIGSRQPVERPAVCAARDLRDRAGSATALAFLLIVAGVTTRNPTIAGMAATVYDRHIVRGSLRISRHPFLWGVTLFAAGHMLVDPSLAAWGFFGTLLVLASTGTLSIDLKRRRALGDDWKAFAEATSNVPFWAIATGRQRLALGEIGWWRPLVGVALYTLLILAHPHLFGVPAVS